MSKLRIIVSIQEQILYLEGDLQRCYKVSTAARGTGNRLGSMQTPLGHHRVRIKIGYDLPRWSIIVGRRPIGEILTDELRQTDPEKDWILTRVLWLEGMERGINRGGEVDTLRRHIYIHGTSQEDLLGQPASHGCIRMSNVDVEELFDLIEAKTDVFIL